jgi:hypothetical protein
MKTKKIAFYLLAGILGGCLPVLSLHPLFTEKDLAFDEKLLGTWVEEPNTTWEFNRTEEPKNAYKLIYTHQENEAAKKNAKCSFIVRLVKLKNNLFLDACPTPWEPEDLNMVECAYNTLFLIPAHTFIKVNAIEPQLKLQLTDDEEINKLLKADPNAVEHTSIEDKLVLTASTKELQAFVLKYADDSRVFTEESVLNRQKTKAPQESIKQKSNEPNDPNKS